MESGREVWPRDPKKAKQAIKQAEFKCEIDDTKVECFILKHRYYCDGNLNFVF
ncbi:5-methylcytosine-specific restriction enzyme A [Bacillus thuringiensis serovar huazhongensis BGSC 4BD1]|nr:hypothetical protein [Bacillus thuringiensis]EEM84116.1 5-methylcytosine-specific restriction enzyme A [Bacillus thuringiensis serovar huazhongensis BGSC 4BD1]